METAYAQALWNMLADGSTPAKAIRAIRDVLTVHGREALLPRIARAFTRLAQREAQKSDIVLTVARDADIPAAKRQTKPLLAELGADTQDLKTCVDDTLIGGWRLEGREHLVDSSHKKDLLSIYSHATTR